MVYRFICDRPEIWGATDGAPIPQSHSDIRAPGANDALVTMYQMGRQTRDAMLPHQGGWSISEAILSAGQATADNLPARQADLQYMIRVPTVEMAEAVASALDRNAAAVAAMTGCRWERHWVSKSRPGLANHALADVAWAAMQDIGPPRWDANARQILAEVRRNAGGSDEGDPLLPQCEQLISPQEAEAILRRDLPPSQLNSTSDDYTDMTWHAPTARIYVARPALAGGPYPAWAMNALGGIPQTIDPMIETAAKVLASTAVRLLEDDRARDAIRAEFETRTGGGIGAAAWMPPLCDYDPPIDFAWPEYVETARGRGWCIP